MIKQKGFIALTAVLVVSALFLSVIIGATVRSINATKAIHALQYGKNAEVLAYACADYALAEHVKQLHYLGSQTLNFPTGSCTIELIVEEADGVRTIDTVGESSGHIHRVRIELSGTGNAVTVGSYKSVVAF